MSSIAAGSSTGGSSSTTTTNSSSSSNSNSNSISEATTDNILCPCLRCNGRIWVSHRTAKEHLLQSRLSDRSRELNRVALEKSMFNFIHWIVVCTWYELEQINFCSVNSSGDSFRARFHLFNKVDNVSLKRKISPTSFTDSSENPFSQNVDLNASSSNNAPGRSLLTAHADDNMHMHMDSADLELVSQNQAEKRLSKKAVKLFYKVLKKRTPLKPLKPFSEIFSNDKNKLCPKQASSNSSISSIAAAAGISSCSSCGISSSSSSSSCSSSSCCSSSGTCSLPNPKKSSIQNKAVDVGEEINVNLSEMYV